MSSVGRMNEYVSWVEVRQSNQSCNKVRQFRLAGGLIGWRRKAGRSSDGRAFVYLVHNLQQNANLVNTLTRSDNKWSSKAQSTMGNRCSDASIRSRAARQWSSKEQRSSEAAQSSGAAESGERSSGAARSSTEQHGAAEQRRDFKLQQLQQYD